MEKTICLFLIILVEVFFLPLTKVRAQQAKKPNIVVITTDQQSSTMLGIAGNEWVRTPNLDKLAKRGVRFTKAYATNPVCVPSKFSMQTGLFPSVIGVRYNSAPVDTAKNNKIIKKALGWKIREAGYTTVFGGKVHLPDHIHGPVSLYGYSVLGKNGQIVKHKSARYRKRIIDEEWYDPTLLAKAGAKFLLKHKNDKKPFFLFLSFMPPHDICYFTIRTMKPNSRLAKNTPKNLIEFQNRLNKKEKEMGDKFFSHPDVNSSDFNPEDYAPPLPDNFEPTIGEPQAIRNLIALRPFRKKARRVWGEKGWREHRWLYARLTERADSLIGEVLQALHKSGLDQNTIVVFTSDHGDNDSSHRLEHKTVFYNEASCIPFIFAGPGIESGLVVDHQVSMGLDLYPTLIYLAGGRIPERLPGISLKPYLKEKKPSNSSKFVFMENQIGFMVTDGRFKYAWYDDKTNDQMLIDLKTDPGEEINLMSALRGHFIYKRRSEKYMRRLRNKYNELQKALLVHLKHLKRKGADINTTQFKKIYHGNHH